MKFTQAGGFVRIGIEIGTDQCEEEVEQIDSRAAKKENALFLKVTVEDSGIGISEEN